MKRKRASANAASDDSVRQRISAGIVMMNELRMYPLRPPFSHASGKLPHSIVDGQLNGPCMVMSSSDRTEVISVMKIGTSQISRNGMTKA